MDGDAFVVRSSKSHRLRVYKKGMVSIMQENRATPSAAASTAVNTGRVGRSCSSAACFATENDEQPRGQRRAAHATPRGRRRSKRCFPRLRKAPAARPAAQLMSAKTSAGSRWLRRPPLRSSPRSRLCQPTSRRCTPRWPPETPAPGRAPVTCFALRGAPRAERALAARCVASTSAAAAGRAPRRPEETPRRSSRFAPPRGATLCTVMMHAAVTV